VNLEGRDEANPLEDSLHHFLDPLERHIADVGFQHQHGLWFKFSDCFKEVPEIVPFAGLDKRGRNIRPSELLKNPSSSHLYLLEFGSFLFLAELIGLARSKMRHRSTAAH